MYNYTQQPGKAIQAPPLKTLGSGIVNTNYPSLTTAQISALNSPSIPKGLLAQEYQITPMLHPGVKKYEVYETPIDILALSVAWKRLRDNGDFGRVSKLLDSELFVQITQADKDNANIIRDYYHKKIMMLKLKNDRELTKYRSDLVKFIQSDGLIVKEEMLGLAYYLPVFHEYDVNLDEVRCAVDANQNFKKLDKEGKPKVLNLSTKLSPLKRIVRKTRNKTVYQYWFKDTVLNAGVLITLQPNNPLGHIWDDMFDNTEVLTIKGPYQRRTLDNFEYFSIDKWELVKG